MSSIGKYRTRAADVEALRIILGTTTKDEIQAFVPGANVGYAGNDPKDIRWVCLFSAPEGQRDVQNDGDWIVSPPDGPAFVLTDKQFNERYVMV
jgi:hypothetical protein